MTASVTYIKFIQLAFDINKFLPEKDLNVFLSTTKYLYHRQLNTLAYFVTASVMKKMFYSLQKISVPQTNVLAYFVTASIDDKY